MKCCRIFTHQVCRKGPTIGVRKRLQDETSAAHARIERCIAFDAASWPLERYHGYLQRLHAFHRQAEPRLLAARLPAAVSMPSRVKTPWLEQDLAYLGVPVLELDAHIPPSFEIAAAWGWAYVLEGAMLGGRTLYPAVTRRWNLGPDSGARYLHGYGSATSRMWNAFTRELEAAPAHGARIEGVIAAANAAFIALEGLFRAG